MRLGIIADIHGNLAALVRVLRELRRLDADRVLCLGDIVGFCAEPNRCVRLIRDLGIASIAGNHDLVAVGRLGFERCAFRPRYSLRRTRRALDRSARDFLASLPATRRYPGGLVLIHGSPDDVSEYMTGAEHIARAAAVLGAREAGVRLCFYGHTHDRKLWQVEDGGVREHEIKGTHALAGAGGLFFVNPGSVDASRKQCKRAEFAVFDTDSEAVEFHRQPYDDARVERVARVRGYRMEPWREAAQRGLHWVRRLAARAARAACPKRAPEGHHARNPAHP